MTTKAGRDENSTWRSRNATRRRDHVGGPGCLSLGCLSLGCLLLVTATGCGDAGSNSDDNGMPSNSTAIDDPLAPGGPGMDPSSDMPLTPAGTIDTPGVPTPGEPESPANPDDGMNPTPVDPVDDEEPDVVLDCSAPTVPRAPLRRLTRFEYNNTVRDLLGVTDRPADALPGEEMGNGFGNDADVLTVSRLLIDGYRFVARDIAAQVAGDDASAQELAGCSPAGSDDTACRDQFISGFGRDAFRRPLEPEETTAFVDVFSTGENLGNGFAGGVRAVVEFALQSPQFLYRVEFGEVADDAQGEPSLGKPRPYEMASRLSYFLWGSTPDDILLDAAEQGQLSTKEQVLAQATRMLADGRSRDVVRHFHGLLYGLGGLPALERSPEYYPTFIPGMGALFQQETEAFVDHVVWEGAGDFRSLFNAPYSFYNETLAQFYGVPGVTGDELAYVELDPARRGGILTQASILALTTPGSRTNPIVRGKWMLEKVLCVVVPDPPVGLMVEEPEVVPGISSRERFAQHRDDDSCRSCHELLDPIGFGFENYDGVGLWRDSDNGAPIDAAGELTVTDVAGPFSTPVELAARIGESKDAKDCYVGSWLTYAYGRTETADDACTRQELEQAFQSADGNIQQLMLALTQTDAFLYRPLAATP